MRFVQNVQLDLLLLMLLLQLLLLLLLMLLLQNASILNGTPIIGWRGLVLSSCSFTTCTTPRPHWRPRGTFSRWGTLLSSIVATIAGLTRVECRRRKASRTPSSKATVAAPLGNATLLLLGVGLL